jgi:flagellar biosynthesis protein FlhG
MRLLHSEARQSLCTVIDIESVPLLGAHPRGDRTIWAVGGGKGGTGKSFFSANLAIHLSRRGEEVVLIDADLGGPNLHTFLGMKQSDVDLGHFFTNRIGRLRDVAVPTPFEGLTLVKGTENVLFTSNLNYFKKLKLIRQIRTFEARRVIIDIGTGSSYNCIDFFLLSNPGILVINPEPTSIENAYYFLKSCIIRLLKMYINHFQIQDLVKKVADQIQDTSRSVYSFLSEVISQDRNHADLLYRALKRFKPCLVVNKARDEKDMLLGHSIVNVVQKYLVIDLDFLGAIPMNESVHISLKDKRPYVPSNPHSPVTSALIRIAERLVRPLEFDGSFKNISGTR